MNKQELIQMVVWLLERLDIPQILRVLSVANRLFVRDAREPEEKT